MSQKYEKLKSLLKELFQLDQPDLDFGLYRIMHAKAGEVTQFLDKDLLPQVKQAFGLYQTADKAEIEKELAKVVASVQAAGMDPQQSPKVQELRVKLATEAVDLAALENEVHDYLYSFFRRYYSDGVLLPRIKRIAYSDSWKDSKPENANSRSQFVKILRLESYEDTLNNLDILCTPVQRSLLDTAEARGADRLREQYMLRYMLDVETRGSQSLLNVQAFMDPTAYKLKVKRPGTDETREVNVDLLETFNWLIGLTVQHIAAPQTFSASVQRDSEKRLQIKGRLNPLPKGEGGRQEVVVSHGDGHHARRPQDADHLAQTPWRRDARRGRTGQRGARRMVHQTGLQQQGP